jgi:hypothetical protein
VKGKLVEVPSNQGNSRNSSPEKGKAPKKKPRTITDIAMEQYQTKTVDLASPDVASNLFDSRTTVSKVPLNDAVAPVGDAPRKKPTRKRSTSKTDTEKSSSKAKSKRASTKSAKPKPVAEKLLSPGSALMRMSKQDILFGTSSQLALEEPPTLVRQLQIAIKESELEADSLPAMILAPPPRWPKLDKASGKRSLWEASSRDVDGGLLEQMADVYIPEFDRTQDFPLLMDGVNNEPDPAPDSFIDVDDFESVPAVVISSDLPTPPRTTSQASQTLPSEDFVFTHHMMKDSVFEDVHDFDLQPPPSNQNVQSQDGFVDIDDILPTASQLNICPPPRPRPPASARITGSHKKPLGRAPKSQTAVPTISALPASAAKPKTSKAKPKKSASAPPPPPPATPVKGSGRFVDIDEILDSEDEAMQALSPTPPRMRKLQASAPLPLYISPSSKPIKLKISPTDASLTAVHRIPTPHLTWDAIKPHIFPLITAHIRSLSPTTNPSEPSWHEKILMYDPIVLEEFTAYLNANTQIRTYKKATKVQIKAWNKEMKLTGGEEIGVLEWEQIVLAVEKELEAYQVQAWCESMSICCIWGEGRGTGGVRKSFY